MDANFISNLSDNCGKVLNLLVARDGIEPPTPAFQGRLPIRRSGLKSTDVTKEKELMPYEISDYLEWFRLFSTSRCALLFARCPKPLDRPPAKNWKLVFQRSFLAAQR